MDGDIDLVAVLAESFQEDGQQSLERLRTAIQADDRAAAAKAAHTLKGTAGNLSGLRMAGLAYELEKSVLQGESAMTAELFGQLETGFVELQQQLTALAAAVNSVSVPQAAGMPDKRI